MVFSSILNSFLTQEDITEDGRDEGDENIEYEWKDYPYQIPGTDMTFPDEEGLCTECDDTWISVGLYLDSSELDMEETYLVILYQEDYKDILLSNNDRTISTRNYGEEKLPEGKLNMTFENDDPNMPDDILRAKEDKPFDYEFRCTFEFGNKRYELDIDLEATKPPATMTDLNGEVELSGHHYRIHSFTSLEISGSMIIDDDIIEVKGLGWIENQRGSFRDMDWDWFAFWGEDNIEMKLVDVFVDDENFGYGMHVDDEGDITTIKDIVFEVISTESGYGNKWEITSDEHSIDLKITNIEGRTIYHQGYVIGLAEVQGEVMGEVIDTLTYVELTKNHDDLIIVP